jgi:hypothetical protein
MTDTTCSISDTTLAAYAAGDLATAEATSLAAHIASCPHCTRRLAHLTSADRALRTYVHHPLPSSTASRILDTIEARARAQEQAQPAREIMTLDEAVSYLRLSPTQAEEILNDLPAFELAGQIRIRRSRLIEWVEQQERIYQRNVTRTAALQSLRSAIAKGLAS